MRVIITKNYQALSKLAADYVIKQIKKKPNSVLSLATGQTPINFYHELVRAYKKKQVDFSRVKTFNLDEYIGLAKENKHSYHYYMYNNFFKYVNLKKENVFFPDGRAKNLEKESRNYELAVKRNGGIDLIVLGIGYDGHLAFNEPGSSFTSKTRVVKLALSTRQANAKFFNKHLSLVPKKAITMGLATIRQAKNILLLAAGRGKAEIVARAVKCKITKQAPASILQTHRHVTIILDREAARKLRN